MPPNIEAARLRPIVLRKKAIAATERKGGRITWSRKAVSNGIRKNAAVSGWKIACSGLAAKGCPEPQYGFQRGMPPDSRQSRVTRVFAGR